MKVLFIIDTLNIGGAEQSLLTILPRFRKVSPLLCSIYQGQALKSSFEEAGIPVIPLGLSAKYSFIEATIALTRVIHAYKPDLLHATLYRSNIIARIAGKLTGVPVISSFVSESYAPIRFQKLSRSLYWKYKIVQLFDRLISPLSTHFVANSESIKKANCDALHIPPHKVTVIHRGRDPNQFNTLTLKQIESLKSEMDVAPWENIILNVGRLILAKGQIDLIEALPFILREAPNSGVLIAGEGPERLLLESKISQRGLTERVKLLGLRNDIPHLLQLSTLFAFPSYYEGHPGALLEAMFTKRPIVASEIPVHRETITHRETGFLVPVSNPEALAEGILWMLTHPLEATQMGEQAHAKAMQHFRIDHIVDLYERLYENLRSQL